MKVEQVLKREPFLLYKKNDSKKTNSKKRTDSYTKTFSVNWFLHL